MDGRVNNVPPYQLGKKWPNRKRPKAGLKRVEPSIEKRKKISESLIGKVVGSKNYLWKGDGVGYVSLHRWVARWKGKPNKCEHCGKVSDKPREMQWANIDHNYYRDLEEYIRLCAKCHAKYDLENNLRKHNGAKHI